MIVGGSPLCNLELNLVQHLLIHPTRIWLGEGLNLGPGPFIYSWREHGFPSNRWLLYHESLNLVQGLIFSLLLPKYRQSKVFPSDRTNMIELWWPGSKGWFQVPFIQIPLHTLELLRAGSHVMGNQFRVYPNSYPKPTRIGSSSTAILMRLSKHCGETSSDFLSGMFACCPLLKPRCKMHIWQAHGFADRCNQESKVRGGPFLKIKGQEWRTTEMNKRLSSEHECHHNKDEVADLNC